MEHITFDSECDMIALEIDRLIKTKDIQGLKATLDKVNEIVKQHEESECASLFYCLANGYNSLSDCYKRNTGENEASNKQQMKYKQLALQKLRKAILILEPQAVSHENVFKLLCVYTNYANELISCGRLIEAIRIFRKAIDIDPSFGMARGNYGRCLGLYADLVNDAGHQRDLHCFAYQSLNKALSMKGPDLHEDVRRVFTMLAAQYESFYDIEYLSKPIVYDEYDLGTSAESAYRTWCLEKHLFLNPLNDVIELESAFAHDPLMITQYTEQEERANSGEAVLSSDIEPPKWFAMLNQLKEEYIYARYLCYSGIMKRRAPHFADRQVKLAFANYDYVNYSIRIEQLKSAYRILFAILDQIAFAVNEFWNIGFSETSADANHVFSSRIKQKDNIALTALYWCKCEFTEVYGDASKLSEKDIKTLRNALEHKFVKVHEFTRENELKIEKDSFYHVSEDGLINHTLRLLELAREWIMSFVYAINIEEKRKMHKRVAVSFPINDIDDEFKL